MTTSESKGRFYFFLRNEQFESIRITNQIANWNALTVSGDTQQVHHGSSKMGKHDWVCITGVKRVYPFFKRFFSCFHMLSCLVMTTRQIVLAKYGNFPISPKIGGRGEESNNGVTTNPQLFIAYSRPFAGSGIWGK